MIKVKGFLDKQEMVREKQIMSKDVHIVILGPLNGVILCNKSNLTDVSECKSGYSRTSLD